MKTRGIMDLYLPKSISKHVKLLLFCTIFTSLWGIFKAENNPVFLIGTFSIMFVYIEIILFISNRISKLGEKNNRKFEDAHTRKEVTLVYLFSIALFLVIALLLFALVFALFLIVLHLIKGWGFPDLFGIMNEKGVIKVAAIALLCSTPFIFFRKWQDAMKRQYELREQNLIFQNETLKNQVNPHFLFNSLNTLSSLVNTEVEIAIQFIGKLSVIYRYILENGSKIKVPLKDEIEFIKDYFYLHKIRNEGKIHLAIEIKDDEYNFEILPVSLQLLIENAIKHNMATQEKPLTINIYLDDQYIVVKNNLQKMASQVPSTKLGLKNLSERVRFCTGKEIIIKENTSEFLVKVPLIS